MSSSLRFLPLFALLVLVAACQPAPDTEDTTTASSEGTRVENVDLGVAVAQLDPFFRVSSNEGGTISLVPSDDSTAGELTIRADEPRDAGGVNLVAAIEEHKAHLEERGGEFKGQRELGGPLGTAFYSRGHFAAEDGTATEETIIFTVHPAGDRVLRLTYVYPQGDDSAQRIQDQLFAVFGELVAAESGQDSSTVTSDATDASGGTG
ncbi:MAG: hypothetical protein MPN21_05910 [Thermoanaerobaculia bacterium]|nr:hypothetical protein [Thermoanaerobaculia bacterium]